MLPILLPENMPTLRKKENCKNWFACYTLPNRRRVQRSTGTSNRKEAEKIANEFEQATQKARTARQAQRVIRDIYAELTGEALKIRTLKDYIDSWLKRKKGEVSVLTLKAYKSHTDRLLIFLAEKANKEIVYISTNDILSFRTAEAERVSARTVNNSIKSLRIVFEDARRDGLIAENPAKEVKVLKSRGGSVRRAFTVGELKAVLAVANDEWKSMILFGLYTGQRLQDIAILTWENVDIESNEVRLRTSKTGRTVAIPISQPLAEHIQKLPSSDIPSTPIHPQAFARFSSAGKSGTLSNQFADILAGAGLREKKTHAKSASGRSGRHETQPLSFHSLRHTATTMMKNAGISPAIVQDIIGHESAEISRLYTHIDSVAKKTAIDAMPNILK